ncbi:hypothetical protein BGX27_005698 [Mortierella sp. AM989]|nr:hypothetical protein BGX27_005698 [Mortierella sp. AM989]
MTESSENVGEVTSQALPPYSSQLDDIQQCLKDIQLSLSFTLPSTHPATVSSSTEKVQSSYPGMVRKDYVLAKLDKLQEELAAIASSLPSLTSFPDKVQSQTPNLNAVGKDGINAKFETIEQMVAGIANALSPSDSTKAPMQHVMELEQEQEPTKPAPFAPKTEYLRYNIELLKNILFDLEKNPPKAGETLRPPSASALVDDDLYIAWCGSTSLNDYKRKIFTLIEIRFEEEEMAERNSYATPRRLLTIPGIICYSEERRKRIQEKMEKIKLSSTPRYSQMIPGSSRPDLPARSSMIETEELMIWCLRSSDFEGYKRRNGQIQEKSQDATKSEKLDRTVPDISSTLTSINLTADTSLSSAYNAVDSPDLLRLRKRMDLVKSVLIGVKKGPNAASPKPHPPISPASDDDDIFIPSPVL